jgi:hypothetical protein
MKNYSFLLVLAALLGAQAFAADGKHQACAPAKAQASQKPAAKKPLSRTGVACTAKTGMGVRIGFSVDSPAPGIVSQVRLQVQQSEGGKPLNISVNPDPALRLQTGLPGGSVVQSVASSDYLLGIVPQEDGLHYLHVFLRSGDMAETVAIPVQVGKNKTINKAVQAQTMPDGQRVISMPAQQ